MHDCTSRKDITDLQKDVAVLKSQMTGVKGDLDSIKVDVTDIKKDNEREFKAIRANISKVQISVLSSAVLILLGVVINIFYKGG